MSRLFSGKLTRRDAIGAAGGMVYAGGAGACASPHMGPKTIPGSPMKKDGWTPEPEVAEHIQTFHLNFTEAESSTDIATRLARTLKQLGHTYPDHDIGALAHTIAMTHRSDLGHEDGVLGMSWCRPHAGHLVVTGRLTRRCLVSDLPSGWKARLLG
jgi:hypothetical protein